MPKEATPMAKSEVMFFMGRGSCVWAKAAKSYQNMKCPGITS